MRMQPSIHHFQKQGDIVDKEVAAERVVYWCLILILTNHVWILMILDAWEGLNICRMRVVWC